MTQNNVQQGSTNFPSINTPVILPTVDANTTIWTNYINGPGGPDGHDARVRLVNAVEQQRRQEDLNNLQHNVNMLNNLNVPRVFPGVSNNNINRPVNQLNFFGDVNSQNNGDMSDLNQNQMPLPARADSNLNKMHLFIWVMISIMTFGSWEILLTVGKYHKFRR